ncbi:MAG TPA: alpha/beta fold hydrolase [Streptosporangiaceae bacterium]
MIQGGNHAPYAKPLRRRPGSDGIRRRDAGRPRSGRREYPVNWNVTLATATGAALNVPPAGANDTSCRPSAAHPQPVILLHGIFQDQNMAWQALAPTLANEGYCVFTMTYGQVWYSANLGGIDNLSASAAEVYTFVSQVLSWTGAAQVDLVGYSEGGFIARLYMKDYGAAHVRRYVGISPVNMEPATISGILTLAYQIPGAEAVVDVACPACYALSTPPAFDSLNTPSATFPAVTYTDIATSTDEVATPYQLSFLPAGPNVTNITIQSLCPDDQVGHLGMPYDTTTVQLALNALDPANPQPVPCDSGVPL